MFRNEKRAMNFSEDMSQFMDLDMWFRLLEQGNFFAIQDSLCAVRRHVKQLSADNFHSARPIEEKIKLLSVFISKGYSVSGLLKLKHLFHMSYRIYLYRKHLSDERKQEILDIWGSRFLYSLMFIWDPIEKYLIKSSKK